MKTDIKDDILSKINIVGDNVFEDLTDEELIKCEQSLYKAFGKEQEYGDLVQKYKQRKSSRSKKLNVNIPDLVLKEDTISEDHLNTLVTNNQENKSPIFAKIVEDLNAYEEEDNVQEE